MRRGRQGVNRNRYCDGVGKFAAASYPAINILLEVARVVIVGALVCWVGIGLVQGLKSGTMRVSGVAINRKRNPVFYWLSAAVGFLAIGLFVSVFFMHPL